MPALTTVGAVVLSMGNRPVELREGPRHPAGPARASTSTSSSSATAGGREGLPDRVCAPCTSRRTSASRRGATSAPARSVGDILFFYDDDAVLPTTTSLARLAREYELDERIAVVQPRGADPDGRPTPRRWIPRLRTGPAERAGDVVVFWEGVCAIRRSAFEEVGGWPGPLLVRPRGHRPRLPPARRRLAPALPARRRRQPPRDAAVTARRLLPDERPQPRVGRQAQPAAPPRRALRRRRGRSSPSRASVTATTSAPGSAASAKGCARTPDLAGR